MAESTQGAKVLFDESQPKDPMEILRMSLTQQQVELTNEAAIRMGDSAKTSVANEAESDVRRVITNQTINDMYNTIAGHRPISYLPAGTVVTSKSDNVATRTLPDGRVEVLVKTPEVVINTDPRKVARDTMDKAAQPDVVKFNLETEMQSLTTMRGDEKQQAITRLLGNIDAEITKARQRIGNQAAIESGYTAAQTALERALQAEHVPNPAFGGLSFNQRYGVASAQTIQAEAFASAARRQMTALEESMMLKDLEITKLVSAKNAISKIELRNAERQAKADEKSDIVTASMVANHKFLYGDMDDQTARNAIISRVKADKNYAEVVSMTPENVYSLIMHPDLKVREQTFKLILEHDKAANNLSPDVMRTPITERIKDFVKDPTALLTAARNAGVITPEEEKEFRTAHAKADARERASLQQSRYASILNKYIEHQFVGGYQDMSKWKSDEISPTSHLGQIIKRTAATNAAGKANMTTVIEQFIGDPTLKSADGKIIPYEERVAILQKAMSGTVNNEFKSILYADKNDLHNKMTHQINNAAARAFIRNKVSDWRNPGASVYPTQLFENR